MTERFPRGLRYMAAGALAFSVMSAFIKLVGTRLPLFEIVACRSLVTAVLSGAGLVRRGHSFRGTETRLLIQRSLLGFVALSCYFYSVIELPLADATVLYFTNPVLTAVAAALILGEGMGWREAGLVGISLGGVFLVARPSFLFGAAQALDPFAVTLGLLSAAFGAGSYITIRSIRHDPPLLVVFYFSAITVALSTPLMVRDFVLPNLTEVLLLLVVGVATHVGQLWVTWGFRLERAGRASAVGYLQIVFAAGWGWLLFREIPDSWTWIGAAVILGATLRLMRVHPLRR